MPKQREEHSEGDLQDVLASISLSANKTRVALRSGNGPDLLKHGAKLLEAIAALPKERLDQAIDTERQAVDAAIKDWGDLLRSHCVDRGLQLAGAYPDFIVEGVVYVQIKVTSASVIINGKRLSALPSDPALRLIDTEVAQMKRARKNSTETISVIWAAYESVLAEKRTSVSLAVKRASLLELLPRIAFSMQPKKFLRNPVREDYTSYSIHNLRADLFGLMQAEGSVEHLSHRLVVEPTSAAEDGLFMYVPALQRCAFVGYVSFVGVTA
jgi:hypothetical protein